APDEALPGHVRVLIEWELTQGYETRAVGAERRDEVLRVEEVPAGLAHLFALDRHEAVDPDLAREIDPRAHEHRGPDDRVESSDVLADHVQVGWPPLRKPFGIVREAGAGDVVDERVEPDIDDPGLGIPRPVLALGRLAVLGDR